MHTEISPEKLKAFLLAKQEIEKQALLYKEQELAGRERSGEGEPPEDDWEYYSNHLRGLPDGFESAKAAREWMVDRVNDDHVDNERLAFFDDDEEVLRDYSAQQARGCCGYFDEIVVITGRPATIGCNYGH